MPANTPEELCEYVRKSLPLRARLVGKERLDDLTLIAAFCDEAVRCGLARESGVIGHDEEKGGELRACELERISGGKRCVRLPRARGARPASARR